jgi:hypothetical protein
MERIWHHNKPAKRGPPTKTHGPGKEGINQRGNKETKDNPEWDAKLHNKIGVSVHRTTLITVYAGGQYFYIRMKSMPKVYCLLLRSRS